MAAAMGGPETVPMSIEEPVASLMKLRCNASSGAPVSERYPSSPGPSAKAGAAEGETLGGEVWTALGAGPREPDAAGEPLSRPTGPKVKLPKTTIPRTAAATVASDAPMATSPPGRRHHGAPNLPDSIPVR